MKITTRCGAGVIEELNDALLKKASDAKVLKMDKVRADTTVVEANVCYPTDSGLLAKAIARIVCLIIAIHAAGGATRTKVRDRRRSAGRKAREIAAHLKLRGDDAKAAVKRINAELADLAETASSEAMAVVINARRKIARDQLKGSCKLACLVNDLETLLGRTFQVVAQTRLRLAGSSPEGATRLVSLHDPDARPIVKGRLGKPVEFGYKAQVVDNSQGIVLDYQVMVGNPADAPLLPRAIRRIKARLKRVPRAATADRAYGEAGIDAELEALGVKNVVIPHKGKPPAARRAVERTRGFRNLVKWRTGAEGRISVLKHRYRWDRSLLDGIGGAQTWCGLGILAHNAVRIAPLIEAKAAATEARLTNSRTSIQPPAQTTTGPPPGPPDPGKAC